MGFFVAFFWIGVGIGIGIGIGRDGLGFKKGDEGKGKDVHVEGYFNTLVVWYGIWCNA